MNQSIRINTVKNQSNTTGIIKYLNIVKYQRIVTSIAKDQSIAISIVIY